MRMVCLEWMVFLDLLAHKVHPGDQETPDTQDHLVCLVKLGFLVNLARWENLVFLVKMAWMVFLELMALRASEESAEQTGFLESLGPRVMKGLRDQEGPQGREDRLAYLDREVLTEQEEREDSMEREAQTDRQGLREKRATRVKLELGDCQERREMLRVSSLNLENLENLDRKEKRVIKENQEILVREVYLENKALRAPLDYLALKVILDFKEKQEELATQVHLALLGHKVLGVCQATWAYQALLGLRVLLD